MFCTLKYVRIRNCITSMLLEMKPFVILLFQHIVKFVTFGSIIWPLNERCTKDWWYDIHTSCVNQIILCNLTQDLFLNAEFVDCNELSYGFLQLVHSFKIGIRIKTFPSLKARIKTKRGKMVVNMLKPSSWMKKKRGRETWQARHGQSILVGVGKTHLRIELRGPGRLIETF